MTGSAIRVAVVDDHPVLRASLVQLVGECEDIELVGQGATGRDAIDIVRDQGVDVLVMDLAMPGQSGLDVLAHVKARAPDAKVLILSAYPQEQFAVTLVKQGASGYLSKTCEPGEILQAIRVIASGRPYITPDVAELLAQQLGSAAAPHEVLSERELQVMLRVARGQLPRDIARELFLSAKTVSTYRARVMEKLGLQTNSDVTYYALKHGLID